ncbi:hypothetical protein [Blastopirellula marina]|uniref:Uncharacterized protein n=1 Tax=Blastopirellula marina DSM 3645 TaxID=314230 RepID=A3ZV15_9BACT|nr:hypothetical protein [Blastopirellula marina]EAQ79751.1 hypothetical protein DSM3645_24620 [Blastopirellula marina DSM 3645]
MLIPLAFVARTANRNAGLIAASLAFTVLTGCGQPEEPRPELIPVKGTFAINGKPAEGAMLVFHPANGEEFDVRGTRPRAIVGQDGQFSMTTYQSDDGIPVGEYDLSVLWFDNPDASNPHDKLGGRYAVPGKSNLRVLIDENTTELEPLTMAGVRFATRRPRSDPADFDQVD